MKEQTTTRPASATARQNRPIWELETTAEEMALCEVVRYLDLRAMHQSNGNSPALADLIRGCYLDKVWSNTDTRQSRADQLKALAKAERDTANTARKMLARIRATEEERATARKVLDYCTTLADNNRGEAEDIEKDNSALTASLAQDMLHTIWIELQAIKADPDRQTEGAFGELCKAGRQFVQNMTAVHTIDGLDTISRPLSVAEAVELMTRYSIDPGARPRQKWTQTAKGCTGYYTLEGKTRKRDTDPKKVDPAVIANYARYNDMVIWYYENVTLATTHSGHTPAFPALDAKPIARRFWDRMTPAQKATALDLDPADNPVLYLVLHVPTIRTHHSAEDMNDHDPRTAEAVTESTLASVDVIALAERAKLSAQARTAVEALTHAEAVTRARQAHREALEEGNRAIEKLQSDRAKAGKKPYTPGKVRQMRKQYEQTADNAYISALWGYALTVAGYTPTAHRQAKATIARKLSEAYHTAPDELTPGQIDYSALMRNSHRGHSQNPGKPADTLKWTTTTTANHKPVVRWTESGHTPEAVNPGEDYRTAEVLKRDSYRQTAPKATPPALSPKEAKERERLCKRDAELAELWKQFDSVQTAMERHRTARG